MAKHIVALRLIYATNKDCLESGERPVNDLFSPPPTRT